jgi:uncharacterized damage-inducible protein DinB
MSTAPVLNLSYPIGKFEWTGPNTQTDRATYIANISSLPDKLRATVAGLSDEQLDLPYRPGGWTVRQLVHHIADSHMNAYIRFKLALTENEPFVKPYDEKAWAQLPDSELPIDISLQLIDALHERWSVVLSDMKPADFGRKLNHPEHGIVELDRFLALYSWHSKHHVAHITGLREREGF